MVGTGQSLCLPEQVVGQFVSLRYQLPDLVVAQITRESVQKACPASRRPCTRRRKRALYPA